MASPPLAVDMLWSMERSAPESDRSYARSTCWRSWLLDNHKAANIMQTSAGTSHHNSSDFSVRGRAGRHQRPNLAFNGGLQAIAHAAQGNDLHTGVGQFFAQPVYQDLDSLQVDIRIVGLNAIKDLLLVHRLAAALDRHPKHRMLAWRQVQG